MTGRDRISPDDLRDIESPDDLLEFLQDSLDWPISSTRFSDVSYEWSPQEVGVDPSRFPALRSIRQLQPIVADQPWGIFFVEFEGSRLPITPLRRMLTSLVTAQRSKQDAPTWQLEDLLFVVTVTGEAAIQLHLMAFQASHDGPDELRTIPWRPQQSPDPYLRRIASEMLPHLKWPGDTADADRWRHGWHDAFVLRNGEVVTTAEALALRMAATATELRRALAGSIATESDDGPLTTLLTEVRRELVADVTSERFADMCAQTLVYGLLAARIADPASFGASPTLAAIPLSNPFLEAFFEKVHDAASAIDEDEILEQLVADLRASNVEIVLANFGDSAKGGDPVIHFYEEFLTRYDRKMRADAGAFYTPQPVVEFMVRGVDEILRTRFGLEMGVADPATWTDVARRNGFNVPAGVDGDSPFVAMIDPATGTGTFPVAWIRQARASFCAIRREQDWPQHLRDVVLPSMHAFEFMLAPFAIAHLKIAMELNSDGVDDAGMTLFLADTLDHPDGALRFPNMEDPVATQAAEANRLKDELRFTVCIGNPPYDRETRSTDDKSRRKGGVVRYGRPGINPLLDDVTKPMSEAGLGGHIKNLYNDYVYFWRWATWQTTELPDGPGIVAFITASSYLDGISMGGLRHLLRDRFDELIVVDLGGDSRGANPEENVFDIRTPVSIAFGIRHDGSPVAPASVWYGRILGSRAEKLATVSVNALSAIPKLQVEGSDLDPLTPITSSDYRSWPELTALMPWSHSGSQFKRTWPIAPSKSVLERRWQELVTSSAEDRKLNLRETAQITTAASPRALLSAERLETISSLKPGSQPEGIRRYGYRSFDRQWGIADARVTDRPRPPLWKCDGPGQVYLTTLTSTKLGRGPCVMATPYVPDLDYFRGSFGAKNVLPLYRDAAGADANVTVGLLDSLQAVIGSRLSPEDLLAYVYGLTATAAFSERFREELDEAAGPVRIPITKSADLFQEVVELGADLMRWHTWGERFSEEPLPNGSAREIAPVKGYPESFSWDPHDEILAVGTGRFGPVPEAIWKFEVSGLKPLQSWLGYRMKAGKGKSSSPLDEIRPERWTFTPELLMVLAVLEHTVEMTPAARSLLDRVLDGEVFDRSELPTPTDAERKAPK